MRKVIQIFSFIQLLVCFELAQSQTQTLLGSALPRTNSLKGFSVSQCNGPKCVSAKGESAKVAIDQDSFVAHDVLLEIRDAGKVTRSYNCSLFRFEVKRQYFSCDNSEIPGAQSLRIDSKLDIKLLNPLLTPESISNKRTTL